MVSGHLGDGYAFLAAALSMIRHHGVDAPPPDTIEGLLYALPEDRYVVEPAPSTGAETFPLCGAFVGDDISYSTFPDW